MYFKKSFVALLVLFISCHAFSQESRGKNEIGIHGGGFFYLGDLAPDIVGSYKTARPAIGIYYTRHLSNYFSLRANFMFGGLAGDDSLNASPSYMRLRKFRFHSPLGEASLLAQFDIFGTNNEISATKLSPYIFAGIGVAFMDIHRDWSRIDSSMIHVGGSTLAGLIKDNNTPMPHAIPVIPIGIGLKYHAWPRLAFTIEGNYRYSFSDYIDGFSYSANPEKKDGYYSITAGAVYNFGGNGGGGGGGIFKKGRRGGIGCPSSVY
jgi:hypothetical protein